MCKVFSNIPAFGLRDISCNSRPPTKLSVAWFSNRLPFSVLTPRFEAEKAGLLDTATPILCRGDDVLVSN